MGTTVLRVEYFTFNKSSIYKETSSMKVNKKYCYLLTFHLGAYINIISLEI